VLFRSPKTPKPLLELRKEELLNWDINCIYK